MTEPINNNDQRNLLVRIDERTQVLARDIKELKEILQEEYITRDEFQPVRMLVYGMAGLMLSGLVLAIIRIVLE